jgi:hypothetical protein
MYFVYGLPCPSLQTAMPERASGTLTPAAMKVRPITVSGIPRVKPVGIRAGYNVEMAIIVLDLF